MPIRRGGAILACAFLVASVALGAVTTSTGSIAYLGNGATSAFTVPYKFYASTDLVVTSTPSGGAATVMTLGVDYTVTGAGVDTGGTVNLTIPPASGTTLLIARATPLTQSTVLQGQGALLPKALTDMADRVTLEEQETQRRMGAAEGNITTLQTTVSTLGVSSVTVRNLVKTVSDYGAKCDGATDDTAAIQSGINALQATTAGGALYLPAATCLINNKLILSGARAVWLVGYGWGHNASGDGGSVLKFGGVGNAIEIGNTTSDQTTDIRILGIRLQGNAGAADGIKVMRVHNMLIEGARIWGFGGNGINLFRAYANRLVRNYINNNTGAGITANENNDFTLIRWNAILANGTKGIWFTNGSSSGTRILENDIEGNVIGIEVDAGNPADQAETFTIGWNYLENQTGKNVSLGEDGSTTRFIDDVMIIGNHMNQGVGGAAVNTISLDRCRRPVLIGNTFDLANLVTTANTTLVTMTGNYFNGSTFPATGVRFSTADDVVTRLGGALPSLALQSNGWNISHHFGMQSGGDTAEWGDNVVTNGSLSGTLDDTTNPGFVIRMAPTNLKMFTATAGVNPRALTLAALWTTTDPLAVGYSASITIDSSTGNSFSIAPTDGNAFTLNAPTNGTTGRRITVRVINSFGVLGAMAYGTNVKASAWAQPANGFSRAIDLQFNGTAWVEVSRTPADVPN